jgi:hypothetical protein
VFFSSKQIVFHNKNFSRFVGQRIGKVVPGERESVYFLRRAAVLLLHDQNESDFGGPIGFDL